MLARERCVLMVVDKQRWYLDSEVSPFLTRRDTDTVRREVDAHDSFIRSARSAGVPVVWTLMTEGDDDAPANVLARWARRPDEPRLGRKDPGFDFAGIGPEQDEVVVEKSYPDAFSVPRLVDHLNALARSTVVLVGSYAGRCVLATAFGAQTRGFDVVVPRGLAEPHPCQEHEEHVFLAVIDTIVGYVLTPEQILREWTTSAAPP
jgi:nicotinamidase-related amidase